MALFNIDPKKKKSTLDDEFRLGINKPLKYDNNRTTKEVLLSAAKRGNIDPSFLASSAWQEGMNKAVFKPDEVSTYYDDAAIKDKALAEFPIDGYYDYGTDQFTKKYNDLKKYLPADFETRFKSFTAKNEKNELVESAAFKTNEDALVAKAAFLNYERDYVSKYAKDNKIDLDQKASDYFTLASYNSGQDNAKIMLDQYGKAKDKNAFIDKGLTTRKGVHVNIAPRLQRQGLANELLYDAKDKIATQNKLKGINPKMDEKIDPTELLSMQNSNKKVSNSLHELKYGGKMPRKKYANGTEDPIDPEKLFKEQPQLGLNKDAKNVGDNVFKGVKPNAPEIDWATISNDDILKLRKQADGNWNSPDGRVLDPSTGKVIQNKSNMDVDPRSLGLKRPETEQGNPLYKIDQAEQALGSYSPSTIVTGEQAIPLESGNSDAEMVANLGITGINAFLGERNSKRDERRNLRKSIEQQVFGPTFNPYAQGTGSQAIMKKGGKISGNYQGVNTLWGGEAEMVSSSDHSQGMIEFKGKSHKKGGIGIEFGGKKAEVEGDELGWVDQAGALNIFGKLKVPGEGKKTFKGVAADLARQEKKVDETKGLSLKILNNADPADRYDQSAISTAKVMFKSLDKQSMALADKKQALAEYQSIILGMINDVQGEKKYGGKVPNNRYYASGGSLDEEGNPITKLPLTKSIGGKRSIYDIKGVVLHKTGSSKGDGKSNVDWWNSGKRTGAADFIIDREGNITQAGELEDWKYHSGKNSISKQTIGIEIVGGTGDESDMTPAQYAALKRLNDEVIAPLGIAPDDYFGHTQVNKKKGFDFGSDASIANVLKNSGISDSYKPNFLEDTDPGDGDKGKYPPAFKNFYEKRTKTTWQAPTKLSPEVFYSDPEVIRALKLDQTYPKAADDGVWGPEHDKLFSSLPIAKQDELLNKSASALAAQQPVSTVGNTKILKNDDPAIPYTGDRQQPNLTIDTPYGKAMRPAYGKADDVNIGNGERRRDFLSPLAVSQIAPELLSLATNKQEPVYQQTYQPELKQTFDLSYQLGRNENQSTFNQVARIAENTGNVDALGQLAAQKYRADEQYNMQEIQGNATQKLNVYGQNIDTLNDAKIKNLALLGQQADKQAAAQFNTRKERFSALTSISGKVLQNNLENRTYNAYANLFKHYGFDRKGNVTFDRSQVAHEFSPTQIKQFGLIASQQGVNAVQNALNGGDYSRKFTTVDKNGVTKQTTEQLGKYQQITAKEKAYQAQGLSETIINAKLLSEFPD